MTLDFGKYAFDVWLSYGLTFLCLAVLIGQSIVQSRRMKALLRDEEERRLRDE